MHTMAFLLHSTSCRLPHCKFHFRELVVIVMFFFSFHWTQYHWRKGRQPPLPPDGPSQDVVYCTNGRTIANTSAMPGGTWVPRSRHAGKSSGPEFPGPDAYPGPLLSPPSLPPPPTLPPPVFDDGGGKNFF